jgi:hypothetical protein
MSVRIIGTYQHPGIHMYLYMCVFICMYASTYETHLKPYHSPTPFSWIFPCGAAPQRGEMASGFLRLLHHTQRHTIVGRSPLDVRSARRGDLYLTTHNNHKRQTSLPPGGIRTHNLIRWAAVDLLLGSHGHWDRLLVEWINVLLSADSS